MSYTTYEILEEAGGSLNPTLAIILYTTPTKNFFYVERHTIDSNGQLLSGAPLSTDCISDMVASFSQEQISTPHGKVPENLLFCDNRIGNTKYIWFEPPKKQMMYFSDDLKIPDGEYYIPGILYVAHNNSLDVYAFKGGKPVNELYHTPFFNTTKGSVCLGNASLEYPENPSYEDLINYWEKKFWLTKFSHLGGSTNPTKHNLVVVTKKSKKGFNEDELVLSSSTLNKLLI